MRSLPSLLTADEDGRTADRLFYDLVRASQLGNIVLVRKTDTAEAAPTVEHADRCLPYIYSWNALILFITTKTGAMRKVINLKIGLRVVLTVHRRQRAMWLG